MSPAHAHMKEKILAKVSPTEEEWADFAECWQPFDFPRNHIITDFGEIERYFYFVHHGVIRLYFEKGEEEYNMGFSYYGEFSGDYESLVKQKSAQYCTETISSTQGLKIHYDDLQRLFSKYKVFERWGRLFNEMILCGFGIYFRSLLADSAEERFNRLMAQSPHVFQIIPQKHLASYLGMTPETFSRMRKKSMG